MNKTIEDLTLNQLAERNSELITANEKFKQQLVDPANHPANGPLTVERIIRLIEVLQHFLHYQNGGDMSYVTIDTIRGA